MEWKRFLAEFAGNPLFHSSMLGIFPEPAEHIQVQLSRWVQAGRLIQVRRGWYLIAPPYRLLDIPLPVIAGRVVHPSYLSLEWALQYYDMIPEYVAHPTLVTPGRGMQLPLQENFFIYHHIQPSFFCGYEERVYSGHTLAIALPEKALLDKIYLFTQSNVFSIHWLNELRLQNLEQLDFGRMEKLAARVKRKGWAKVMDMTFNFLKELEL